MPPFQNVNDTYRGGGGDGFGQVLISNIALPVEFISFNAYLKERQVVLNWETTNEHNNEYFDIEKSSNFLDLNTLGSVPASNKDFLFHDYQYIDKYPFNGNNYYRLKQVDFNGNYSFSKWVSVFMDQSLQIMTYPNPASAFINLQINNEEAGNAQIKIIDLNGRQQQSWDNLKVDKNEQLQLPVSFLQTGFYLLIIQIDRLPVVVQSFMKQ